MNTKLNKLIKISLLSALAFLLMYIDFPIIPLFPWLRIDLSDVPALLGAFGFGPLAGVLIELMKNILIVILKGTQTGLVGETANFLFGVALIVPISLVYARNKSKKGMILGMVLGAVCMEVVAIIVNVYFLLPAYGLHMSLDESVQYVTIGLLPFNGLKSLLVSVVTYFLYRKTSVFIFNNKSNLDNREDSRYSN